MRVSSFKWTQAHFSLKIIAALEGEGPRLVKWAHFVQPKGVNADHVGQPIGLGHGGSNH